VIPFISVYGRSGSGKSTVVKFICVSMIKKHELFDFLTEYIIMKSEIQTAYNYSLGITISDNLLSLL
jgi:DNA helicase HerA-like ATPase